MGVWRGGIEHIIDTGMADIFLFPRTRISGFSYYQEVSGEISRGPYKDKKFQNVRRLADDPNILKQFNGTIRKLPARTGSRSRVLSAVSSADNSVAIRTAELLDGVLNISGTHKSDYIAIHNQLDLLIVSINGYRTTFDRLLVHTIVMSGGSGDDVLINNTELPATLRGGDGNDYLLGGMSTDEIAGGAGNDVAIGRGGDDNIVGGLGDDVLLGRGGEDYLDGGEGYDRIFGGKGHDTLRGTGGNDFLHGGRGDDKIYGGSGNDYVNAVDAVFENDYANLGFGNAIAADRDLNKGKKLSNQAPIAVPDFATTRSGKAVAIKVRGNDIDLEESTLKVRRFSQAENGRVRRDKEHANRLVYKPKNGFTGTDTFTYVIGDGHGNRVTGTVTISVINHAPVPIRDRVIVKKGKSIDIAVRRNDFDSDGDFVSVRGFQQGQHGSVQVKGPNRPNILLYKPNKRFTGTDYFWYEIVDAFGASSWGLVEITVAQRAAARAVRRYRQQRNGW